MNEISDKPHPNDQNHSISMREKTIHLSFRSTNIFRFVHMWAMLARRNDIPVNKQDTVVIYLDIVVLYYTMK